MDALKDATALGTNFARKLAARQLPAVKEYSAALQDYADGKTDAIDFGKSVLNLGVREAMRGAEEFVKFSSEFYSKLFSTTQVKVAEALGEPKESAEGKATHKR